GALQVDGQPVPTNHVLMANKEQQLLATFFYTDGRHSSPSLAAFKSVQLLKRFRRELPLAAMVRIIVPVQTDVAAAEQTTEEFAEATLPAVLARLRQAGSSSP